MSCGNNQALSLSESPFAISPKDYVLLSNVCSSMRFGNFKRVLLVFGRVAHGANWSRAGQNRRNLRFEAHFGFLLSPSVT